MFFLESVVIGVLGSFLPKHFRISVLAKSFDPNIWHICGATHPLCEGLKSCTSPPFTVSEFVRVSADQTKRKQLVKSL